MIEAFRKIWRFGRTRADRRRKRRKNRVDRACVRAYRNLRRRDQRKLFENAADPRRIFHGGGQQNFNRKQAEKRADGLLQRQQPRSDLGCLHDGRRKHRKHGADGSCEHPRRAHHDRSICGADSRFQLAHRADRHCGHRALSARGIRDGEKVRTYRKRYAEIADRADGSRSRNGPRHERDQILQPYGKG